MITFNLHEQFVINEKGEKTAVLLPFDEYEKLLEDIHDLSVIADRKDEKTISLNEIQKDTAL
jgi:PHD/YefM family antitoxin component YafN of YafNO toxin-antitoxin module